MLPPFARNLCLAAALWLVIGGPAVLAQATRDRTVELTAIVQQSPPTITLGWNATGYTVTAQQVYRRLKGAASWGTVLAPPAVGATSYTDPTVVVGVNYEYRVVRTLSSGPGTAYGYISSGIRVPVVTDRGRVILLVDDTMATPLATELARFTSDLIGDGWTVVRQNVSRTATPASVRTSIQAIYTANPSATRAVILFGHVPVPYSGNAALDGHPDHQGAWPTDLYYGEMTSTWTDSTVNNSSASDPRNRNVPGDGKFDATTIPSSVELQVGRIDLENMTAFGVSETELLRRYLDRDHAYRHQLGAYASVGRRGLVDDNFGYFNGEAFAVTAWRSFTACVGAGAVQELDWFGTLQTQSYLWAYGCGPGNYVRAEGVGTSDDFATKNSLAVFTLLFGSYFGDWDNNNAFLRAPLAGTAASLGLVSCWAGRPHWFFHPMALGETVGYSARLTQNNSGDANGYDANNGQRLNHIALHGDPTLRLYPVVPPTNLTATVSTSAVTVYWTPSPASAIEGYFVARATSAAGPFVQLPGNLVTGATFTDNNVTPGTTYHYLVRAVKLETSPTGTYLNPSQASFSAPVIAGTVSGPEINLSGNGNPITAGDATPLPANGTAFGSVEMPGNHTRTFTIANVGATTLNIGAVDLTGANPEDFALSPAPPVAVVAGGSVTFGVRFTPSVTGQRTALLTLTNSDANEGSYQFAIGGEGQAPAAGIAVYPPAVNRSIHPGSEVTETLQVSNPALGTLTHAIISSLTRYNVRDSDSFGGPLADWVEISTTGTEISGWANNDDALSGPIALGFNFAFYGSSFSTVRVCTNGFLTFTDTGTSASNLPLPNGSAPGNLIAALWSDLVLGADSHIYTQTVGGNFVVQFEKMNFYTDANARLTFQVVLQPDGVIRMNYGTLSGLTGIYTIGLQNAPRDNGLLVAHNVAYVHSGLSLRIRPPGLESWLSISAAGGTVPPGGAQEVGVTLKAAGLAPGNYFAELLIASNAPGQELVTIPVRLTVGQTPIESWRIIHFGSIANAGDGADGGNADGDAGDNLLEYALGRDPETPETVPLVITETNAAGYLQIRFERNAALTDLRYIVEATSDLTTAWTPIASGLHGAPVITTGAYSSTETGASEIKAVVVTDVAPASAFTARYLRLRIVRD